MCFRFAWLCPPFPATCPLRVAMAPSGGSTGWPERSPVRLPQNVAAFPHYTVQKLVSGLARARSAPYIAAATALGPRRQWITRSSPADRHLWLASRGDGRASAPSHTLRPSFLLFLTRRTLRPPTQAALPRYAPAPTSQGQQSCHRHSCRCLYWPYSKTYSRESHLWLENSPMEFPFRECFSLVPAGHPLRGTSALPDMFRRTEPRSGCSCTSTSHQCRTECCARRDRPRALSYHADPSRSRPASRQCRGVWSRPTR